MNATARLAEVPAQPISFTLDGQAVQAQQGDTIFQAAQRLGVDIPHLCYREGHRADGNCRACVVEIEGERTLAPSCCRQVSAGMQVQAGSERARKSQKLVLEMLLSDMPDQGYKWHEKDESLQHGELSDWADCLDVTVRPALKALRRVQPAADVSHPAMAVNLDACIQCKRCVTACREE
ncbi:MAG: 2Fe-2S iron-sulfur cluster-binding protein, partial [Polaromonas sp.]|nr:2Fe-2S iron-sulfur cluster-binding protein [Polaromonas sp.]